MGAIWPETPASLTAALQGLFSDWKTWAIVGAVAIALYFALASTPKAQARSVARRKARAKYRAELERIREEF